MGDRGSRRGAANLAIPLMLVSFLLIGLFLWWLSENAESTEVVIDERPDTAEAGGPTGTEVTGDQLRTAPGEFVGQVVRVSGLGVAGNVGTQAFFLDVPQSPFLVKMDTTLVARGASVPTGRVTVVGTLHEMSDSVARDWVSSGVITPGEQPLVEFATHFIEATQVRPGGSPQGGAPQGSGAGS